ncbi:MAG TPA: PAS domain-containing protein, partial [Bryobacteraceae bacterium]|nr:PAS domain-containing protein [Bryobacteraceae bacterium]
MSTEAGTPRPAVLSGSTLAWLAGGGDMGDAIRSFDWSGTILGPIESWPEALRVTLGLCLNSRFPMFVWWGRTLINFYNDAYIPILGKRHPGALGRNAPELWHDVWPAIANQVEAVFERGEASWHRRIPLVTNRNGYNEDAYFTYSHSPVFDGSGRVSGLLCVVTEETEHVMAGE